MSLFTRRQREILDASVQLIDESGIQNLTIKNLANRMQISEPAIYRHFDSKIDILIAILDDFNLKIEKNISVQPGLILEKGMDSLMRIKHIFTNHLNFFTGNPAMASVVFSEEIFQNDKRLSDRVYSIMKYRLEIITGLIKKGQEEGAIRSDVHAEQIALLFTGSLRMIVARWRLSKREFDLVKSGSDLIETIIMLIS